VASMNYKHLKNGGEATPLSSLVEKEQLGFCLFHNRQIGLHEWFNKCTIRDCRHYLKQGATQRSSKKKSKRKEPIRKLW